MGLPEVRSWAGDWVSSPRLRTSLSEEPRFTGAAVGAVWTGRLNIQTQATGLCTHES
jgi:hypothetical protein